MDKFLKYFENETFVRWVLEPDQELNNYWKAYITQNSSEKEAIDMARMLILQLRSKKRADLDVEAADIYNKIVKKIEREKRQSRTRGVALSVLKYAAVGLICFSLGMATFYFLKSDHLAEITEQLAEEQGQNNLQLLLGDDKSVYISEKSSEITYQNNGEIVINKQDTVSGEMIQKEVEMNQVIVPYGKNTSIVLSDGTRAFLNAGSRLIYPSRFTRKTREVYLFGEAFFEVAHNQDKPFIVKTNDIDVEVLGTKFNLSVYPSDKFIETVLVEGKVRISENGHRLLNKEYILQPNQRAAYNRDSEETEISNVDVEHYVSWHKGYLNFESLELNRVIKKLERYYNIKIVLNDPMLGLQKISGKLKLQDSEESAMNVLVNVASAKLTKINKTTYMIK